MRRISLSTLMILLGGLFWVALVFAATAYRDRYKGVETSPGVADENTRVGRTFSGPASGKLDGTFVPSLNYTPPDASPRGTASIFGGSWTLTTANSSTLFGSVPQGSIQWSTTARNASVTFDLTITGGTGDFVSIVGGNGSFKGTLNNGDTPPTLQGQLNLTF